MLIESLDFISRLKEEQKSFYIYFSAPNCGVCEALKPKIGELMESSFPLLQAFQVDTKTHPEIASQLGLFTNPSLLVFFEGKEFLRKSRTISISQLHKDLYRPYSMIFM